MVNARWLALTVLCTLAVAAWVRADETSPRPSGPSREGAEISVALPKFELPAASPVPVAQVGFEEAAEAADAVIVPLKRDPPHWANGLIDHHALIYRETRSEIEILGRGAGFGMTSLGFSGGVDGDEKKPFWFNPKLGWHFLEGPSTPDVRSQFYDLALEVNFAQQVDDHWSLHLQFTPTWASDFDNKDGEALRFLGGGLLAWRLSELWTAVGGVNYLDREDLPWLPIAGFRLASADVQLDLVVPRPRLAWRLSQDEKDLSESWIFVAGEVGGGAWAFEREDTGLHDVFNYRDLRLLAGFESREIDGARTVFEAGYVFERQIEFEKGPGRITPGDTWLLRWGATY
jgi:hypothetical protein